MRTALAIAAALVVAAGLAACGEKDEPEAVAPVSEAVGADGGGQGGGVSTEKQETGSGKKQPPIRLTVEVVLNGSAASVCSGPAVTPRYIRTAYGDELGCEAAIRKLPTFDVAVSDIEIRGTTATAKAKPDGGPNKGETIKVGLVREGGTWKVDSAVSNARAGP